MQSPFGPQPTGVADELLRTHTHAVTLSSDIPSLRARTGTLATKSFFAWPSYRMEFAQCNPCVPHALSHNAGSLQMHKTDTVRRVEDSGVLLSKTHISGGKDKTAAVTCVQGITKVIPEVYLYSTCPVPWAGISLHAMPAYTNWVRCALGWRLSNPRGKCPSSYTPTTL